MKVRELVDLLKEQDPEATVASQQSYDGDLDEVEFVRPKTCTRVTRRECVNSGETYWTNCPVSSFDDESDDAEELTVVVLR